MSKWEIVRLGDVATVVSGSTPKTSVKEYWDGEFVGLHQPRLRIQMLSSAIQCEK